MDTQEITKDLPIMLEPFILHSVDIGDASKMVCKKFTAAEVAAVVLKSNNKDNKAF